MTIIVTGAAGFIGRNLLDFLGRNGHEPKGIVSIDKLGYGSSEEPDGDFIYTSLENLQGFPRLFKDASLVINLAAETHIDRSIANIGAFFKSNVQGVASLLEALEKSGNKELSLVHVSTDEVFGPSTNGVGFGSYDSLDPHNPYAGTKAAGEMLVRAWSHQRKQRAAIVRLCNVFGPYQYPEKLIPKTVISHLLGKPVPVYGNGLHRREWMFVEDACSAIWKVAQAMKDWTYNFGAFNFSTSWNHSNMEVLAIIQKETGPLKLEHVKDRPGHDQAYRIICSNGFDWVPESDFETRVRETAKWFLDHREWWERILQHYPMLLSSQPWLERWY